MKIRRIMISCAAAVILASGIVPAADDATAVSGGGSGELRVGTFDSRAVALAYGRSETFLEEVRDLEAEAEQARQNGNRKRLEELESRGAAKQEELHRQVFGGASIDEILASMESALPEVARAAKVDMIVRGTLYHSPRVRVVDISREMAEPFDPDEKTLKILEELLKTPPIDMD